MPLTFIFLAALSSLSFPVFADPMDGPSCVAEIQARLEENEQNRLLPQVQTLSRSLMESNISDLATITGRITRANDQSRISELQLEVQALARRQRLLRLRRQVLETEATLEELRSLSPSQASAALRSLSIETAAGEEALLEVTTGEPSSLAETEVGVAAEDEGADDSIAIAAEIERLADRLADLQSRWEDAASEIGITADIDLEQTLEYLSENAGLERAKRFDLRTFLFLAGQVRLTTSAHSLNAQQLIATSLENNQAFEGQGSFLDSQGRYNLCRFRSLRPSQSDERSGLNDRISGIRLCTVLSFARDKVVTYHRLNWFETPDHFLQTRVTDSNSSSVLAPQSFSILRRGLPAECAKHIEIAQEAGPVLGARPE